MTDEEFLQRYDSGKPNFTEDEIKDMAKFIKKLLTKERGLL